MSKYTIYIFPPFVIYYNFIFFNIIDNEWWKNVNCIFAHQEFYGCKMGAIESIEGDKWDHSFPLVIRGHIHSEQRPQKNIFIQEVLFNMHLEKVKIMVYYY